MTFRQPCPNCRYQRKASDTAPDWQCPKCGVAYAKVLGVRTSTPAAAANRVHIQPNNRRRVWFDRLITYGFIVSLIGLLFSLWAKNQLPDFLTIVDDIHQQPRQTATRKKPFEFDYRGTAYTVQPVADYELWGVVVTHNDIHGMLDITHTDDSVDIKDICVVWGSNIQTNDYREVSYSSGDFTCYFQYGRPLNFYKEQLSNNHLLTDNAELRKIIRDVKIGDQVHIKGMLVNYWQTRYPNWKRNSSTVRTDKGNGACEVVFVNSYEVLRSSNAVYYAMFSTFIGLMVFFALFKIVSIAFFPKFLQD